MYVYILNSPTYFHATTKSLIKQHTEQSKDKKFEDQRSKKQENLGHTELFWMINQSLILLSQTWIMRQVKWNSIDFILISNEMSLCLDFLLKTNLNKKTRMTNKKKSYQQNNFFFFNQSDFPPFFRIKNQMAENYLNEFFMVGRRNGKLVLDLNRNQSDISRN